MDLEKKYSELMAAAKKMSEREEKIYKPMIEQNQKLIQEN